MIKLCIDLFVVVDCDIYLKKDVVVSLVQSDLIQIEFNQTRFLKCACFGPQFYLNCDSL